MVQIDSSGERGAGLLPLTHRGILHAKAPVAVGLGGGSFQGEFTQEAVRTTDVKLQPPALGDIQEFLEGLFCFVILLRSIIPFAQKWRKQLSVYTACSALY